MGGMGGMGGIAGRGGTVGRGGTIDRTSGITGRCGIVGIGGRAMGTALPPAPPVWSRPATRFAIPSAARGSAVRMPAAFPCACGGGDFAGLDGLDGLSGLAGRAGRDLDMLRGESGITYFPFFATPLPP
mgnify:CR=1 FL=1